MPIIGIDLGTSAARHRARVVDAEYEEPHGT